MPRPSSPTHPQSSPFPPSPLAKKGCDHRTFGDAIPSGIPANPNLPQAQRHLGTQPTGSAIETPATRESRRRSQIHPNALTRQSWRGLLQRRRAKIPSSRRRPSAHIGRHPVEIKRGQEGISVSGTLGLTPTLQRPRAIWAPNRPGCDVPDGTGRCAGCDEGQHVTALPCVTAALPCVGNSTLPSGRAGQHVTRASHLQCLSSRRRPRSRPTADSSESRL